MRDAFKVLKGTIASWHGAGPAASRCEDGTGDPAGMGVGNAASDSAGEAASPSRASPEQPLDLRSGRRLA